VGEGFYPWPPIVAFQTESHGPHPLQLRDKSVLSCELCLRFFLNGPCGLALGLHRPKTGGAVANRGINVQLRCSILRSEDVSNHSSTIDFSNRVRFLWHPSLLPKELDVKLGP
jgi:hypothetical protein